MKVKELRKLLKNFDKIFGKPKLKAIAFEEKPKKKEKK